MMPHNKNSILYLRTDLGTTDLIGGGSVTHTLGVINGLLEHGRHIVCFSSAMHGVLKQIDHEQFSYTPLSMPSILKHLGFKINCLLSNLFFYRTVNSWVKKHKPDLIYQRYSMLNVVGAWLKQQYNIPFILEFNGSETWIDANWSGGKLPMGRLIDKIEMYNVQQADTIVVVSDVLKSQLIARGVTPQKILVNPNGVDVKAFNAVHLDDVRATTRNLLGLHDQFVIGFSGTFSHWHGVNILAELIPQALSKQTNLHFLLIGDGPLKTELAIKLFDYIGTGVTFTGMLNAQQMPAYLSACDAFLCPTQPNKDGTPFFGSPTKLFEYMAMGKPIIASNIGQVGELLADYKEFLFEPDDIAGFAQAVTRLIKMHPDERAALGKRLRDLSQHHSWSAHVARIMKASVEAA